MVDRIPERYLNRSHKGILDDGRWYFTDEYDIAEDGQVFLWDGAVYFHSIPSWVSGNNRAEWLQVRQRNGVIQGYFGHINAFSSFTTSEIIGDNQPVVNELYFHPIGPPPDAT